jgi:Cu(I)/Ag(I) efflux system membrane fusion protein
MHDDHAAEPHGFWWKTWLVIKVLQVRLRFIAVLVAVGALLVYWDTLMGLYDKWRRPGLAEAAADAGYEFWCPMHPNIVRDHPGKCPLCFMPLSKRRHEDTREGEALPPGVVRRVQLSPYKVALAGVQTSPVSYQQLYKEIRTVGFIEFDERKLFRINCRLPGQTRLDKLFVNFTGDYVRKGDPLANLYNPDLVVTVQNLLDAHKSGNMELERSTRDRLMLWGIEPGQIDDIVRNGKPITHLTLRAPLKNPGGHPYLHVIRKYQVEGDYVKEGDPLYDLADLSTVWLEAQVYEDEIGFLEVGMPVTATIKGYPTRRFTGKAAFIHPHMDKQSRTLKVRFDMDNAEHELRPGGYGTVTLKVPMTQLEVFGTEFDKQWRDHLLVDGLARVVAPGFSPLAPHPWSLIDAGMALAFLKNNYVLAVPESAVIDTGTHKYVYRTEEPNIFDAVEVELGPRSGSMYPVVRGLKPGDEVATAGSFNIDAETRLTAGAASTYYGASGGAQKNERRSGGAVRPSSAADEEATIKASLDKLDPPDRALAAAQTFCAVLSQNRLGSMGTPVRIMLQGEPVFLCCQVCIEQARAAPATTVARVRVLRAGKDKKQKR